jgi:hypothetical protein
MYYGSVRKYEWFITFTSDLPYPSQGFDFDWGKLVVSLLRCCTVAAPGLGQCSEI